MQEVFSIFRTRRLICRVECDIIKVQELFKNAGKRREAAYKEVVRTFVNTTDEITHVTIENAEGEQETIVTESNTNRIITGFPGNASKYDP